MDEDDFASVDPLDEPAPPARDGRGRFRKGSSGNPVGRRPVYFPRNPNVPHARRRVITSVADEEVEVKVNGKPTRMTLYEANIRALALAGTKSRVAAQRFIELVMATTRTDLLESGRGKAMLDEFDKVFRENERLRKKLGYGNDGGVLHLPADGPIENWSVKGAIARQERELREAAEREMQEREDDD